MTAEIYAGIPLIHQDNFRVGVVRAIMKTVSDTLSISPELMISSSRKRDIVEARQIAIGLILKHDKIITLVKLGKLFGNRDHSTMIYSKETFEDLLKTNASFKQKVNLIKKQAGL